MVSILAVFIYMSMMIYDDELPDHAGIKKVPTRIFMMMDDD